MTASTSRPAAAARVAPRPTARAKPTTRRAPSRPKRTEPSDGPWQPPAIQRSSIERSIGFPGAIVPEHLKKHTGSYDRDLKVLRKGHEGSPEYDKLGYPLSFTAIKRGFSRPRASRKSSKKQMEEWENLKIKKARIQEIMGRTGIDQGHYPWAETLWQDRVARDLDIPFHTIGLPEYEEWGRRGFRLQEGELIEKPDEAERERISVLQTGSALREGYVGS